MQRAYRDTCSVPRLVTDDKWQTLRKEGTQSHGTLRVSRVAESDWELTKRTYSSSSKASWLLERTGEVRDAGKRSAGLRGPRHEHFGPFDHCGSPNRRVGWNWHRRFEQPMESVGTVGTVVAIQDDSEDHLQLDPAQPGGHRRHLPPHGERRAKWQPGHLLDRCLGQGKLQHLGCRRHLRRRRDLRH